jgi:hypothetical protein
MGILHAVRRVPFIAVGAAVGGTALLSLVGAVMAPPDSAAPLPVPTLSGETSQGEPISAVVENGRLAFFDASVRQLCEGSDGAMTRRVRWSATVPVVDGLGEPTQRGGDTNWQYTWHPALGPDRTIVDLGAVPPNNDGRDIGPDAATSTVVAKVADDRLSGTLSTSIAVAGASCRSFSRFSLPRPTGPTAPVG